MLNLLGVKLPGNELFDKLVFRTSFVWLLLVGLGLGYDVRWHELNPLRDHYFIAPHLIMYVGIILLMATFFVLFLRGYKVPLWVFVLFPLLSIFDEFWHTLYGVELYTDPMMFWSPAHWPFGLIIIYIVYVLKNLKIEDNEHLLVYIKAVFFSLIIKFFYGLLAPLSVFSFYKELHTDFNIFTPSLVVLLFLSITKFVRDKSVLLPLTLIVSMYQIGSLSFFAHHSDLVYNTISTQTFIYFIGFLFALFGLYKLSHYLVVATIPFFVISTIKYIHTGGLVLYEVVFSLAIVLAFTIIYFYLEEEVVSKLKKVFW